MPAKTEQASEEAAALDKAFANLHVCSGIAHASALALQSDEHDAEVVAYALEYAHQALEDTLERLRQFEGHRS